MKKSFILMILFSVSMYASASNPAGFGSARATEPSSGSDALTSYTSHSTWYSGAGTTELINFDSITSGTVITTELSSYGISNVSGKSGQGVSVDQIVLSSSAMPFSMFTAGSLPTEPNFISNNMTSPFYAYGSITFELSQPATAIGAYIADGYPLDGFHIELFNGAVSLGYITVPSRTLPDSFVGVISDSAFDSAVFYAENIGDSWGLDNLELNSVSSLESGTWGSIKASCF